MMQLSRWKVIVVIAMAVFGLLFAAPNLIPSNVREGLPAWIPAKTLNLGLDLQGGSYLLLEVNTETLKRDRQVKLVEDIRNILQTERIAASSPVASGDSVRVRINDPAKLDQAYELINPITQPTAGGGSRIHHLSRRWLDDLGRLCSRRHELRREPRRAAVHRDRPQADRRPWHARADDHAPGRQSDRRRGAG